MLDLFWHKFELQNLWLGKPVALTDDLMFSTSWLLGCYSLYSGYKVFISVLLNREDEKKLGYQQIHGRTFRQTLRIIFGSDLTLMLLPTKPERLRHS